MRRPVPIPAGRLVRTRRLVPVLALLALAACSSSSDTSSGPNSDLAPVAVAPHPLPTAEGPRGAVGKDALGALLLQATDLPELTNRRTYASDALVQEPVPQLALCRPVTAVAPHEVANVLATSGQMGTVRVFQVVQVFQDDAGAKAAFDQAERSARSCTRFTQTEADFTVEDLSTPAVPGAQQSLAYRLGSPDAGGDDARTLARAGRHVVMITGRGLPPAGQSPLAYQAAVMAKAVARLQ